MSRVGKFGDEDRGCSESEGDAESDDDTSADERTDTGTGALNDDSDDHDEASDDDGKSTTEMIRDVSREGRRNDGAQRV